MRHVTTLAVGTALYLYPQAAFAQTATPTTDNPQSGEASAGATAGIIVYQPDFFASFAPNTAPEMIQRLPGFALDIGNTDTRGLSGASGNVLIDGDRPTSKSDTLDEILRRIAASGVERIELIRGGAPGIDMQGRSVVANVVLKRTVQTESVVESNTYFYPDGYAGPQLKGQYSRREGDKQTEAAFLVLTDRTGGTAWGSRQRLDAAGNVLQTADLTLRDRLQDVNLRGSVQRIVGGGKLRLNVLADYMSIENSQRIDVLSGGGSDDSNTDTTNTPAAKLARTGSVLSASAAKSS